MITYGSVEDASKMAEGVGASGYAAAVISCFLLFPLVVCATVQSWKTHMVRHGCLPWSQSKWNDLSNTIAMTWSKWNDLSDMIAGTRSQWHTSNNTIPMTSHLLRFFEVSAKTMTHVNGRACSHSFFTITLILLGRLGDRGREVAQNGQWWICDSSLWESTTDL